MRRLLPYGLPAVLLLVALLSSGPSASATASVAATAVPTAPPTTASLPPTTIAPPPPTTAPPPPTTAPAPPERPAPTPRPQPVAVRPAPVPPPPRSVAGGRGTWAVIVGANDYPGANDLDFAEADALDVADALTGVGVPGHQINLLTGASATAPALRAALDWLVANAGPDALGVVFFAGHVSKQRLGGEELRFPDGGALADTELAARLRPLQARRAWIAVASCYGGGFTEVLAPGRILTGAAGENEKSYETPTYNRSYLVQYMIREAIIERRTAPTVQDAFAYAAARQGGEHHPVQFEMNAPTLDLRG